MSNPDGAESRPGVCKLSERQEDVAFTTALIWEKAADTSRFPRHPVFEWLGGHTEGRVQTIMNAVGLAEWIDLAYHKAVAIDEGAITAWPYDEEFVPTILCYFLGWESDGDGGSRRSGVPLDFSSYAELGPACCEGCDKFKEVEAVLEKYARKAVTEYESMEE